MNKYRDLLFDADETLFDFAACEESAFYESAKELNIPVDPQIHRLYSAVNDSLWKAHERGEITREDIMRRRFTELLEKIGSDTALGVTWNKGYESALSRKAYLFDDTVSVCTELSGEYRLSIITNGLAHVQRGRMSISGIADLFGDRIFISGEIGYAKPDVRFFERVADALEGFDPKRALVIGDSLTGDIEGAARAGIDSILIDRRNLHPNGDSRTLMRIRNLRELAEYLKSMKKS